ncbi:MAG: GNAT family N-acetyltransferase [Syntrophomonas sp.]
MVIIDSYRDCDKEIWDSFVRQSKNGTFLFLRDYMDYHRERFEDNSLLLRNEKGGLLALLPGHRVDNLFSSHAGLSYGGFICDVNMTMGTMLEVFEATLLYLQERGFTRLFYKCIPYIYHSIPAEEDRYALFLANARLSRRDSLSVIDKHQRLPFTDRRMKGVKKAQKMDLYVAESKDYRRFWAILSDVLASRHRVKPVHSLTEIELLSSRFPENIKLFACFQGMEMLAGVVVYESERIVHYQYGAANPQGKRLGALDMIFDYLINNCYRDKDFIDFGNSNEENGRKLNQGLTNQKEGFGARMVVQDFYEIDIGGIQTGDITGALK